MVCKKVNDGAGSINGELTDKIYLGDGTFQNKWLMIGDTAEHAYKGTFNGNGYTVYFLDAEISEENPDVRYAGLFGVVDGGTISNVKVSEKFIIIMQLIRPRESMKNSISEAEELPVI